MGGREGPGQDRLQMVAMDRGAWEAAVYEVAKSRTRLSDFTSQTLFLNNNS